MQAMSDRSEKKRKHSKFSTPSKEVEVSKKPRKTTHLPSGVWAHVFGYMYKFHDQLKARQCNRAMRQAFDLCGPCEDLLFFEYGQPLHQTDSMWEKKDKTAAIAAQSAKRQKFFKVPSLCAKVGEVVLDDRDSADGRPFFPNATHLRVLFMAGKDKLDTRKTGSDPTFGQRYHSIVDPKKLTRIKVYGETKTICTLEFEADIAYPKVTSLNVGDVKTLKIASIAKQFPAIKKMNLSSIWYGRHDVCVDARVEKLVTRCAYLDSLVPKEGGSIGTLKVSSDWNAIDVLPDAWKTFPIDNLIGRTARDIQICLDARVSPVNIGISCSKYTCDRVTRDLAEIIPRLPALPKNFGHFHMAMSLGVCRPQVRVNTAFTRPFVVSPLVLDMLHKLTFVVTKKKDKAFRTEIPCVIMEYAMEDEDLILHPTHHRIVVGVPTFVDKPLPPV